MTKAFNKLTWGMSTLFTKPFVSNKPSDSSLASTQDTANATIECEGQIFKPELCEAIFDRHPSVKKAYLIVLTSQYKSIPAVVVESNQKIEDEKVFCADLLNLAQGDEQTKEIKIFFQGKGFRKDKNLPTPRRDVEVWARHNKPLENMLY